MSLLTSALLVLCCILLSGLFSGSETGFYSLSRLRVEADAHHGLRSARLVLRLLRNDTRLLVTLLVANNLVNQLAAHFGRGLLGPFAVPPELEEVALTLLVAPPLFVLGELVPKDLFHRRPHAMVAVCAPAIALAEVALAPLVLPLRALAAAAGRALGLEAHELARVRGREAVLELFRERETHLAPHVERMARNALELRSLRVERVMIPWRRVETLPLDLEPAETKRRLARTPYTRLVVLGRSGGVAGYVHQLEVLGAPQGEPLSRHLRPMIALEPSTPLDRALARLRASGQRAALVGSPERPLGLVTLKDLVEEISGELWRW